METVTAPSGEPAAFRTVTAMWPVVELYVPTGGVTTVEAVGAGTPAMLSQLTLTTTERYASGEPGGA
jgi:hypothetical protein